MIKLTFCLRRKPGMSKDDFHDYWRNKHAPLVKSHRGALNIARYVQTHNLENTEFNTAIRDSRKAPEPYDGVAELWWNSWDDLRQAIETEEGRKAGIALLKDEATFIDLENSPLWYNEEHEIFS